MSAPTSVDPTEQIPGAPMRRQHRSPRRRTRVPAGDPNPLGLPYDEGRRSRRAKKPPLRHRVLPRTVIGITMLLLALAMGAAFSGAVLYAYYDWRLSQNEDEVGDLISGFDQRYETAAAAITAQQDEATARIRTELEPLAALVGEATTISQLAGAISPSVWFVATLDEEGRASVGSAFVVASDSSRSLLLTSYTTIRAATANPGPQVVVRKGDEEIAADVWTWQPERDLALLVVPKPDLPALAWAPDDVMAKALGTRVYAASGLGGVGASLSPGYVIDQSLTGLQHTVAVGTAFQGGPLLNSQGQVLGVASLTFSPLGFPPGSVLFAPPVTTACDAVLSCGSGGAAPQPGAEGSAPEAQD
ncbi:MAG: trypsin-like peptidase domain-containing protein [Acidimicrobiales bacterium]|nr:trypsin-like peptidase domain-containing protein [Acidimicrobiales bacterium]